MASLFSAVQTGAEQFCSEGPGTCPAGTRFCYGGGGDQSSSAAQITVTPYPARIEGIENQVYCQSKQAVEFSGPNAASVWQAQGADDFWVFHGCDGAGVMQDCFGGNSLVEHYLGKADAVTEPNRCDFQPTDCFNPNNYDACWCPHTRSSFVHPGTSGKYWVDFGQYSWCSETTDGSWDGQWPDQMADGANAKQWWPTPHGVEFPGSI